MVGLKRANQHSPWTRVKDGSVVGYSSSFPHWHHAHPMSDRHVLMVDRNGLLATIWYKGLNWHGEKWAFICEYYV